ncbi:peroxidasin homolog isoform X2 [Sitophilus oryzae]|uniref:Peroxidasin homolog isoform X2 n=1 Tax=Sitophilus oryzae TaxID=7048 RepID=A0A6J2YIK6_SITOR|nr:peroxidasin homolog isoform X2 [Sitophilus oryzae]
MGQDISPLWLVIVFLTWPTIIPSTKILITTENAQKTIQSNSKPSFENEIQKIQPDDLDAQTELLFEYGKKLGDTLTQTIERTLNNDPKAKAESKKRTNNAISFGIKSLENLVKVKEPTWFKQGLYLKEDHPAVRVAHFGAPRNKKAVLLARYGYAALEAAMKIAESYHGNVGREIAGLPEDLQARIDLDECPLRGLPTCPPASKRFRTADGTCNNPDHPWRGSALFPMQRFLAPVYEDGLQSIRRSIFGDPLPSPRQISKVIHVDRNNELQSVTLMFMQWGQFIDHDITSTVKIQSFNESIPQCCGDGGRSFLHSDFLHPSCLPIEVSSTDPFLSRFGVRCMEFTRSAPSTRIDCKLGWREQINQVTSYIDASTVYGSDVSTSDSLRTFRHGKLFYGRPQSEFPLNPPDPPGREVCREGAVSEECLQSGDGRVNENIALVAMHTIFVRYHNKIATILARINPHWSDERIYQETRKIIYSIIQHITYKEYLPIVVGPDVMELFELRLLKEGYYKNFDKRINPTVSNAFSTAAFRFGHSLVQNSFIRTDNHHRSLPNNVTLHEEFLNFHNIWSPGSLDRLLLGLSNQPSQKRDEFIAEELTNHLFQFNSFFGMDLAALNIQRGRDHGIPPYTYWRKPCGLSPIKTWEDLDGIISVSTVVRLRTLYLHVDDVDLFTGGLAERPLKGAVTGPTFACIIAQQFSVLRKGDRFWYENGDMESSFTIDQLNEIRKVSLAQVLCQTMTDIETIQPFVFLSHDNLRNLRIHCESPNIRNFDLAPWEERSFDLNSIADDTVPFEDRSQRRKRNIKTLSHRQIKAKLSTTTTDTSGQNTTDLVDTNVTDIKQAKYDIPVRLGTKKPNKNTNNGHYYKLQDSNRDDITYLFGILPETSTKPTVNNNPPLQVNINIQYAPPQILSTSTTRPVKRKKKPTDIYLENDYTHVIGRPTNIKYPTITYTQNFDRPNLYGSLTGGHKKPNLNGNSRPMDNYYRPIITKPTYIDNTDTTVNTYHDNLDIHPHYPSDNTFYNRHTSRPTIFEDRPFSTSNRPIYNDYDDDDSIIITKNKLRPQFSGFEDKEDSIDDIINEFFQNQRDTNRKKLTPIGVDDKLDFELRTDKKKTDVTNEKVVGFSSVRTKERLGRVKRNIKEPKSITTTDNYRLTDPPNDMENVHVEYMDIPELPIQHPCSYQVPKPMNEYFSALPIESSNEKTRQ